MDRMRIGKVALVLIMLGFFPTWLTGPVGQPANSELALAAELNVNGLPSDPKAFRTQVEQIVGKVDSLINKLKDNKDASAQAVLLDLIQTRDNILREVVKVESTPDGAKWGPKDMRNSVEAMLQLLKAQYEKASALAS